MSSQTDDQVLPKSLAQLRIVAIDDTTHTSNNKDCTSNPFEDNVPSTVGEQQVTVCDYFEVLMYFDIHRIFINSIITTDSQKNFWTDLC